MYSYSLGLALSVSVLFSTPVSDCIFELGEIVLRYMEQIRILSILRYFRTLLGELAAAMLIAVSVEGAAQDVITLTKRIVLFILSSILYIYLEELLNEL